MDCFGVFNQVSSCQEKQTDFQRVKSKGSLYTREPLDVTVYLSVELL